MGRAKVLGPLILSGEALGGEFASLDGTEKLAGAILIVYGAEVTISIFSGEESLSADLTLVRPLTWALVYFLVFAVGEIVHWHLKNGFVFAFFTGRGRGFFFDQKIDRFCEETYLRSLSRRNDFVHLGPSHIWYF